MAECPSHELVTLIAETCRIKDQKHFSLLYTALSNLSLKSINSAFLQQGIRVEGLALGKKRCWKIRARLIYADRPARPISRSAK
jgi:hypothetical protein